MKFKKKQRMVSNKISDTEESVNSFSKATGIFLTLVLTFFIWEKINPTGFDIQYRIFNIKNHTSHLPEPPLLETSGNIPQLSFKNDQQTFAHLFGIWDSIKIPFPNHAIRVESTISSSYTRRSGTAKENVLNAGLELCSYKGTLLTGTPIQCGIIPGIRTFDQGQEGKVLAKKANTSMEWLGYLKINTPGEYHFSLSSDDGSFLFIDNLLVISNSGSHGVITVRGKKFLSEGYHKISLKYFNNLSGGSLDLLWSVPNHIPGLVKNDFRSIPESHFFTKKNELLEFRKQEKTLNYPSNATKNMQFDIEENDETKVTQTFKDMRSLTGVDIFKRDLNGTYKKASLLSFKRDTSKTSLFQSIFISLILSLAITSFTTFVVKRGLRSIPYVQTVHIMQVIFIAVLARLNNLGNVPALFYTKDEFMETWIGLNLILIGKPSSWAWPQHAATTNHINYIGELLTIAEYQFHPPPFFSIIVGSWLYLLGVESIHQLPIFLARMPSFIISIITLLVVIKLFSIIGSKQIAILGGLFFALFPANVVLNSIIKSDNLVSLLSTLTILCIYKANSTTFKNSLFIILGTSLALLSKEIGIFISIATCVYALQSKKYFLIPLSVFGTLLGVTIYLSYAYYMNWSEFIYTMKAIEGEGLNLSSISRIMLEQQLYALSSVMVFSWIGLLLYKNSHRNIILIFALSYALTYSILSPGSFQYPWHQLCLFPLIAFGFAYCLESILDPECESVSTLMKALILLFIFLPFLSEFNEQITYIGAYVRRGIMILIAGLSLTFIIFSKSIPKKFSGSLYFLILCLAYLPFVYMLIFKNYV